MHTRQTYRRNLFMDVPETFIKEEKEKLAESIAKFMYTTRYIL